MKYQQLDNLETGWKWGYLIKKHREGEVITRHIERSSAYEAIELLLKSENQPDVILSWIENHMNPALDNRLKQAIRAKRKRYFNAEQQVLRKKSIDLDFLVWQRLATLSQKRKQTLSETIIQLIDDAERKEKYENQLSTIKNDLQSFLKKTHEK